MHILADIALLAIALLFSCAFIALILAERKQRPAISASVFRLRACLATASNGLGLAIIAYLLGAFSPETMGTFAGIALAYLFLAGAAGGLVAFIFAGVARSDIRTEAAHANTSRAR